MLCNTLRIVPLLVLGAMAPNLQESRVAAVPVSRVQVVASDGATLAMAKVKIKKKVVIKRKTGTVQSAQAVNS